MKKYRYAVGRDLSLIQIFERSEEGVVRVNVQRSTEITWAMLEELVQVLFLIKMVMLLQMLMLLKIRKKLLLHFLMGGPIMQM